MPQFALSIPDAAEALGVSRSTLYRLASKGELVIRRLGGRSVVLTTDVEALAKSLPAAPVRVPHKREARGG